MKTKLLSIGLAVPALLIGSGEILASIKVNAQENLQLFRPAKRISQVTLSTQQPPPLYLAARDDQQKECQWLGLCDGKDKDKGKK